MIEQIGVALAFSCFFTENKLGKAGLTNVTCDIYRTTVAGVTTLIVTNGAATVIGGGLYRYEMAAGLNTVEGEYHSIFKTLTTSVDQQHVPGLWVVQKAGVENLDGSISSVITAIGAIAAAVWAYTSRTLTQTITQILSSITGTNIVIQRGDTVVISFNGLGSLVGRTGEKIWFTVKSRKSDADIAARVQVTETTGAKRLNGSTTTASFASIVVTDEVVGNVEVTLRPEITKELAAGTHYYDLQILKTTVVNTLASGEARISEDITRAIV